VLDAITHLWELQEANPARPVCLIFLTTSPIGAERANRLGGATPGLAAWQRAAEGGDVADIRAALRSRLMDGKLAEFLRDADDATLRERLLKRLTFACGAPDGREVERANRAALVAMRAHVRATADAAERAHDALLLEILNTIIRSPDRTLTRDRLIAQFEIATSIAIPSQVVFDMAARGAHAAGTRPETARTRSDEQELRRIARQLLEAGTPPSLLPLFPGATNSVRRALDQLARVRRAVTERREDERTTRAIVELTAGEELHHLVIAPPGSGKTHALWHAAR
jgi:hypothetical protein